MCHHLQLSLLYFVVINLLFRVPAFLEELKSVLPLNYIPSLFFFLLSFLLFLKQGLIKLPKLSIHLQTTCFSLLNSWDYRPISLHPSVLLY